METVKKISGPQDLAGRGGMKEWSAEDFSGRDTGMVDTCHHTFIQTQTMFNTKSKP
jgi:hypothetical protein